MTGEWEATFLGIRLGAAERCTRERCDCVEVAPPVNATVEREASVPGEKARARKLSEDSATDMGDTGVTGVSIGSEKPCVGEKGLELVITLDVLRDLLSR